MVKSETKTNLRSAPMSSAEIERMEDRASDDADQLLIQQWLEKKGNVIKVYEDSARTAEEDINYLWKSNKAKKT